MTDDDLTALYAWLMTQPAVRAQTPPNTLAFPFNLRPLLSAWTALFLTPGPAPASWQRGEYLVNALGHCGACHHDGDGPQLLGVNIPLALNSNLHSDHPDNLLRAILEGVREPAAAAIGFMPAFAAAFDDAQIVSLAAWMRARFAPERPPWNDLPGAVARLRAEPSLP